MHEHTIAAVGEEEGHGLILTVGLRALRIGDGEVYLLPYLIQRGERLTAAVDALTRCQRQHGVDATRIVGAAFDKRERQEFHLRGVVVDAVTRLCEDLAVGILDDDAPGVFL